MNRVKESIHSISETIAVCLKNKLTFAAYRLPEKAEQNIIVQQNSELRYIDTLSNITELKGFFVSPFLQKEGNRMFIIQPDFYFKGKIKEQDFYKLNTIQNQTNNCMDLARENEVSKKEYLEQIKSVIKAIEENRIEKAVLSRVKIVKGNFEKQLPELFSQLCESFPNAFTYMFRADGHFWMGATPEPFAFLKDNTFQTSSVAGTRENIEKYMLLKNWGSKEIKEQEYVSDHISRILKTEGWPILSCFGPYVKKAGNMFHLRTDFTTNIAEVNGNVGYVLEKLHPTPAVCGYPTAKARQIIVSTEKHNREYYSGFLGPVGLESSISLFVNLRCMRITENHLSLYTGSGITIDSVPEDEWQETEMKTQTLLSAIKNIT